MFCVGVTPFEVIWAWFTHVTLAYGRKQSMMSLLGLSETKQQEFFFVLSICPALGLWLDYDLMFMIMTIIMSQAWLHSFVLPFVLSLCLRLCSRGNQALSHKPWTEQKTKQRKILVVLYLQVPEEISLFVFVMILSLCLCSSCELSFRFGSQVSMSICISIRTKQNAKHAKEWS